MRYILLFLFLGQCYIGAAQWINPENFLEGQAWSDEVKNAYDRLPARAENNVTKQVWRLQTHSAGLMFRFRANASEITVRYGVSDKNFGMDHMPATGKSGVDLYAISSDGEELWCASKRSYGDTITYKYSNLNPNDRYHKNGREYRLYLPLYNHVEWMEVSTDGGDYFAPLKARKEKPIVVYGTSIAQGACASRPGMAWTAQLSRKMDRPLINLGFSGNGLLAPEIIDLVSEIDAKIYILDCLPNLVQSRWERIGVNSEDEFKERIMSTVRRIREKRDLTPILLVEHAGYTEEGISIKRKEDYALLNRIYKQAYIDLKKEGIMHLYYMTKKDIDLSQDAMVDGVHPTDLGMKQYADAYEVKLREILNEYKGVYNTTQPIVQYREPGNYDWEERHNEILRLNKKSPPRQVILANSIIHYWGGEPSASVAKDAKSWQNIFTPAGLRNMAYGWDRIENVLWRVQHGELDGYEAERVLVMIGTNNIHMNSDEEILKGLEILTDAIRFKQPHAEIVLMGLLPRRDFVERIQNLNFNIAQLAGQIGIRYNYIGGGLTNADGSLDESLFSDGLHPNIAGYQKMKTELAKIIR